MIVSVGKSPRRVWICGITPEMLNLDDPLIINAVYEIPQKVKIVNPPYMDNIQGFKPIITSSPLDIALRNLSRSGQ